MIEALISIGFLMLVNIVTVTFFFGRLSQQVNELRENMKVIRKNTGDYTVRLNEIAERTSRIEGRLNQGQVPSARSP